MDVHADLEAFLKLVSDSWRANDGKAFASFFAEDGSLINPFGERADGRQAVATMYGTYFDGMLRGTSTTIALDRVRPIGTEHAFLDAEQTINGTGGEVVLVVHLSALLRRGDGGWQFLDSRPYAVAAPPG